MDEWKQLHSKYASWRTPKLLDGLNYESKGEDNRKRRSWGVFPGSQHFGGRGACWSFGMGLGGLISNSIIHTDLHKPNNKSVSAYLEHFGAQTHKTHHGPNLGETITFPFIVDFVHGHGTSTQMSFCLETPKWESQNSQSWDFHNFGGVYLYVQISDWDEV